MVKVSILIALPIGLFFLLPRWAAHREEARRETLFQQEVSHVVASSLPDCPPSGPQLDTFLLQSQSKNYGPNLWRPLCRIPDPPLGKITVTITRRDELENCSNPWTPSNLNCDLDESISYLANPQERHTWAQKEVPDKLNRQMIWISSRPLAWQDQLVIEYQTQVQIVAVLLTVMLFLLCSLYRLRLSIREQQVIREEDQPRPPRIAELFFLWISGRNHSMPADINQEYGQMLAQGWSQKSADRWYRRQVRRSILPIAMKSLKNLIMLIL